ncbi:hypothetical protein M231_04490 [Tremella mesenterica]|uniref:Uncharacterized protein n=1 Tax=Tremella mesenterica TaxID=5217 RepID=A0A4Q1BKJ8_TREME|nr:hypothetical protein M231_04490 [Tremella mesenterica]
MSGLDNKSFDLPSEPYEEMTYPLPSLDKDASINPAIKPEETMFNHDSPSTSPYTRNINEKTNGELTSVPTTNQRMSHLGSSVVRTSRDISEACKSATQATTKKISSVSRNAVDGVLDCCMSDGCATAVVGIPSAIVGLGAVGILGGIGYGLYYIGTESGPSGNGGGGNSTLSP